MNQNEQNMSIIDLSSKRINNIDNLVEVITHKEAIKTIDISNNNISFLPDNLCLFPNLECLILQKNPFNDFNHLISVLSTLPSLRDLTIDIETQENALLLLNSLPQLQILNGNKTIEDSNDSFLPLEAEIPCLNEFIQRLMQFFRNSIEKMEAFKGDFEQILKEQIDIVNQPTSMHLYETNTLNAKITLHSYIQGVLMTVILNDRNDKDITMLLCDVIERIKELQMELNQINRSVIRDITELFQKDLYEKDKLINELQLKLQDTEIKLKHYMTQNKAMDNENKILNETVNKVKNENCEITNKLLSKAKDIYGGIALTTEENYEDISKYSEQVRLNTEPIVPTKSNLQLQSLSKVKVNPSTSSKGILTENQLLEIIEAIYKSKINSDKINSESHQPIETLEQHMYTFLNQKYGLKKLIVENATTIINGIRQYSLTNSEICLFGKVLRNEVDEESISIMKQLKQALGQILIVILKEKFVSQEQIERSASFIKSNSCPISKEMIQMLIQGLFSKDKEGYCTLSKKMDTLSTRKNDGKIYYSELFNHILDYHIRTRSKYLTNIAMTFRKVDKDSNGIVTSEELSSLLMILFSKSIKKNQLETFKMQLDPFGLNQITFSQVVSFLQKIPLPSQQEFSLLDSISSMPLQTLTQ